MVDLKTALVTEPFKFVVSGIEAKKCASCNQVLPLAEFVTTSESKYMYLDNTVST